MSDGLQCECAMPLAWREAALAPMDVQAMLGEATLLLGAINQIESGHELESGGAENRRLERLEAKMDLVLYLLARSLEPGPAPTSRAVRLGVDRVKWADPAPPAEATALVLELRPSEALPLTVRLPAVALAPDPGMARARLDELPEALVDVLTQFVFRRHRQAIRARTG